ncbi:hypothetical protein XELAEV_18030687mg [Xenopus laevis]|uniref:Uncharacterized protein n=1 Tax=Xenopus laevis TaxID=8355 RepID=A0A974CNJ2_XENLA|nr:hypothetical protein XELAEV_18030687mg [Xenopus laevis]
MPFPKLKSHVQKLANLILTATKQVIARNWKKIQPPTGTELKTAIQNIRRMEYLAGHRLYLSQITSILNSFQLLWAGLQRQFRHIEEELGSVWEVGVTMECGVAYG